LDRCAMLRRIERCQRHGFLIRLIVCNPSAAGPTSPVRHARSTRHIWDPH
jgi:hypothetical protein